MRQIPTKRFNRNKKAPNTQGNIGKNYEPEKNVGTEIEDLGNLEFPTKGLLTNKFTTMSSILVQPSI